MKKIWGIRLATLLIWALAGASLTYWLLKTSASAKPHPALARAQLAGGPAQETPPSTQIVASALGAIGSPPSREIILPDTAASVTPTPIPEVPDIAWNAERFRLVGVMAQGTAKDGLVMLSVDGKPAQMLRLGSTVETGIVVQSVTRQTITLANIKKPEDIKTFTLALGRPGAVSSTGGPATTNAVTTNSASAFRNDGVLSQSNNSFAPPDVQIDSTPPALAVPPPSFSPPMPNNIANGGSTTAAAPSANAFIERLRRIAQQNTANGGSASPSPLQNNNGANSANNPTRSMPLLNNQPPASAVAPLGSGATTNSPTNSPVGGEASTTTKSGDLLHFSD